MDYALNHSCTAVLNSNIKTSRFKKHNDGLILELHLPEWFLHYLVSSVKYIHFDFNYSVIQHTHNALDCLSRDQYHVIQKLFPVDGSAKKKHSKIFIDTRSLDGEYQTKALCNALRCQPTAPFLIMGPFGTGKSRLLVYAALNILRDSNSKVLVCTHLNRGADYFCENYYHESYNGAVPAVRIASESAVNIIIPNGTIVQLSSTVCELLKMRHYRKSNRLFVTTFGQAFKLYETCRDIGYQFTHILIDEGAQTTEPEVICALSLASQHTKIIIAGDNKQVSNKLNYNYNYYINIRYQLE